MSCAEEVGGRSPRLRNGRPNPRLELYSLSPRSRGLLAGPRSRGFGGRGAGCRAPGCGWRRAGGGGGLNVRPRPLRCAAWREGCTPAAAAATPQVIGGRVPGAGVARSRRRRSGEPGPEGLRRHLGLFVLEAESGGASPRSPGDRGEGPGRRGAEPARFPGSGESRSPRGLICRVTTRKRDSAAEPLACFLTPAPGDCPRRPSSVRVGLGVPLPGAHHLPGWDAECRCPSPP